MLITLPTVLAAGITTVPTLADLPATAMSGWVRYVVSETELYYYNGSAWVTVAGGSTLVDLTTDVTGVLPVANGGTNSSTALNNNRVIRSSGGSIGEAAAITASRALISDANGLPTHSTTTSTEIGYVNGVTSAIQTQLDAKVDDSEKGANNGVATLDAGGKIPASQLPSSVMDFKGTWAASTNTPTLTNGDVTASAGDVYLASDAGTVNFGAGNITFAAGDWAVYNGSIWEKSINSNAVVSVNGQTGVVSLDTADIAEDTNLYFTDERAQDAVGGILANSTKVSLTYLDGTPSITGDILAGSLVNADISGSAAIERSKVANGTADHVVINSGAGALSSEAQLATSRGGTGQNFSASTGVVKVASGTMSAAAVSLSSADVSGVLPLANGGTNKNLTASAGAVLYSDADSVELSAVGTAGMPLRSAGTGAPAFSWNSIRSGTDAYIILTTDGYDTFILTGTTSRTFTLPAASSSTGRPLTFINNATSSAVMTVTRAGSDTIGPLAETSILLSLTGDTITLISDGATWNFIGGYYQSLNTTYDWQWNGSGSTDTSVAARVIRRGSVVTLTTAIARANTGTSSTSMTTSTALPTWAHTVGGMTAYAVRARNNGSVDTTGPGRFLVTTTNFLTLTRFADATFTNGAEAGFQDAFTCTYVIMP